MPSHQRNYWVEGIGDDVLIAFGAFFGMFLPMLYFVSGQQNQNQEIHPESEENVQATRTEVNNQRLTNHQATGTQTEHNTENGTQPIRENHGQHTCPICLGAAEFAIQTNCGHIFCGTCIVTYWRHGTWLGAVNCPVCRQLVTILLVNFTHAEHNNNSEEKRNVVDAIYQYNRRFSGQPRPWMDYIRDLPTLLRHAFSEAFSVGGLFWMFRLRVIFFFLLAIFYFLSPFDIIPEAAFGLLGFLDDIFVVLLLAIYITLIYRNFVHTRATNAATNAPR